VITVLTRPVEPGVLATISGTLDHEGQVDALTSGLACLSSDGTLIVDLSGVVLAPARIVQRLADDFGDRFAAGDVRVVASRLSTRLLLDRAGVVRPVFASVADAIDH
jgi:hypothetical protein